MSLLGSTQTLSLGVSVCNAANLAPARNTTVSVPDVARIVLNKHSTASDGTLTVTETVTVPSARVSVPETAPVEVLKVHDDETVVAAKVATEVSVAETSAIVEDAVVGSALPVAMPVVSR